MNTSFPTLDAYVRMPDIGSITVVATKYLPTYIKGKGPIHQIQIGRIIFVSTYIYESAKHPLDLVSIKD